MSIFARSKDIIIFAKNCFLNLADYVIFPFQFLNFFFKIYFRFFKKLKVKIQEKVSLDDSLIDKILKESLEEECRLREKRHKEKITEIQKEKEDFEFQFKLLRDPRHLAWQIRNIFAERGIELDVSELIEIINSNPQDWKKGVMSYLISKIKSHLSG